MKLKLTASLLTIFLLAMPMAYASQQDGMVEVPVLKDRLLRFGTITPEMIAWRQIAETRVPSNIVRDDAALIGMQATRNLSPNAFVSEHAVRIPPDVSKNSEVMVIITHPSISLKMTGKALDDGLVGEQVRILNMQSNKVFTGKIIGTNKVQVN